ncbi:MAG: helix-turn-helix transcriptional regulator [Treponema sp.]|nr:helix-turn-helix transcriptional regulator [Treponema sp.]
MDFAENLKELLDEKDIMVKELSAGTGISKNTLENYLSGQKSIPNAENAVKIAQFMGTTVEFLVTGESKSRPPKPDEETQLLRSLKKLRREDFVSIKTIVESLLSK